MWRNLFNPKAFRHGLWSMLIVTYMSVAHASQTLVFRDPDPSPLSAAVKQSLEEAYAKLDVQLRYVDMSRSRSLVEADNGRIAGELGRLPNAGDDFSNLVRSHFPLFEFQIVLVADRRFCGLCNFDDVDNLAYINGQQSSEFIIAEKNYTGPTVQVTDTQQLHLMLTNERVRAVLINNFEARALGYYEEPNLIVVPLLHAQGYHYLNKQHADLMPKIDAELARMKASGRLQEIFDLNGVFNDLVHSFDEPPSFPALTAASGLWPTFTEIDGSGKYWRVLKLIFEPVSENLELHAGTFQRAVAGLKEQRFDILMGANLPQVRSDGIQSRNHIDYDRDLYGFTLTEENRQRMLKGELDSPVCFVAGYTHERYLPASTRYYRAAASLDCFAMLDMKRVGAVITYFENQPDWIDRPYVAHKLRDAEPIFALFQDTPEGRLMRDWFDQRFYELVESGKIADIYAPEDIRRAHFDVHLPGDNP